ncbi:phosphonoacetate hydrolase [Gordonia sinesedis]
MTARTTFSVNDRVYSMPTAPVVVICVDGSEPAYHFDALAAGRMPWLESALRAGASSWPAECAVPTLTNPNNLSIATGQPPCAHGISGNYFYDKASGTEVLMNEPHYLRAPTIFAEAARNGLGVAVVTAKDKLRRLLGAGLVGSSVAGQGTPAPTTATGGSGEPVRICFSAEKAGEAHIAEHGVDDVLRVVGRPQPATYSAELSEFTLAAGLRLLRSRSIDLLYLSLTDYVQHKHPPGSDRANDFYAMIDSYARDFDDLGAIVVITGDHGMNAKTHPGGSPKVVYLDDECARILGADNGIRVVLPITDPYTAHHGAFGSSAYLYLPDDTDLPDVARELSRLNGIDMIVDRCEAARRFDLPPDRIGDLVVLADAHTVVGRSRTWHDTSGLDVGLRSHGGIGEIRVPFIVNRALPRPDVLATRVGPRPACVHNYDAFWVATTLVSRYSASTVVPADHPLT